jgi:ferric enterobactin receptor
MCRRATIPLAVLVFLIGTQPAFAQCRVSGELRTADGAPIPGATIRVESPDLRSPVTGITDASGRYAIDDVKPGIWAQITAIHQNGRVLARTFSLVTQRLEIINLRARPESGAAISDEDLDPLGGPSADLRGVITGPDGSPVAGARVSVKDTRITTTTDSAGRYAFPGLRSGVALELDVAATEFSPAQAAAVVPEQGYGNIDIALAPPRGAETHSVDLTTFAMTSDDGAIQLRPRNLARLPTADRQDLFRALQFLPAASAAQEVSSELFVRGGTPDQMRVSLDGFTLYPFRHLWGGFSALNMDAIAGGEFAPASIDAAHGGHLAGNLRLTGATGSGTRPQGVIDLSILGLATKITVPLGARASLLLAGRRSPPSSLYGDLVDYFYGTDTDVARMRPARFTGGLFRTPAAEPSFYDLNGKLRFQPSLRDRVALTLYSARDIANRSHDVSLPSDDGITVANPLSLTADAVVQMSSVATWRGRGASAVWDRQWTRTAATVLTVARSEFSRDADSASIIVSPSTGADYSFAAGRGGSQALSEQNAIRDATIRVVSSMAFGYPHVVSAGAEIVSLDTTYNASTEVSQRVADSGLFTSSLSNLLRRDDDARATTVFAQDAWRPFARVIVTPGVRVTRYDLTNTTYVDPRINATYFVLPQVRLTGGFTLDHQYANRIVRDDPALGDGMFWTLADGRAIPVPRARQGYAGATVEVPGLLWSVRAYYKQLNDLTLFAPRLLPGLSADAADTMVHIGSGRALGIETVAQHATDRNTLWASLTIGRTEYTYPTLRNRSYPASFERPTELKISDTLRFGRAWSVSGVWVAAGGRPVTPAEGVEALWFPSGEALYRVAFGDRNSGRLAPYHRLDLSGQRDFSLGGLNVTAGSTVFNLYDRQNIAYTEYHVANAAVTSNDVLLMRRAVNVFVRFAF